MKCFTCGRIGHPSYYHKNKSTNDNDVRSKYPDSSHKYHKNFDLTEAVQEEEVTDDFEHFSLFHIENRVNPLVTKVSINQKALEFQIDTGASLSVMF